MSSSRLSLALVLVLLCAAVPLRANSMHGTKSASNNGTTTAANFDGAGPTISGISTTLFMNSNESPTEVDDVFTLPGFSSGAVFTLTFNTSSATYGIFNCNNGSNNFAVSSDSTPIALTGPCTVGSDNTNFVNFVDGATSATMQFNPSTGGAPPTFVFWVTDGELVSITSSGGTTQVAEPSTIALLGAGGVGLVGLLMFRRRDALTTA
jgi:hypothetical protein